jgi:uncharacterized Zn-binding protein involved in type VI secretion
MPNVARHGDIGWGVCVCHPVPILFCGPIIVDSGDVYVNERGEARLGDITINPCGHTGTIVTASGTVYTNERGVARLGDYITGCNIGTIITASGNVSVDL